ncbi:MAG: hypothetical protein ACM3QZ_10950 [Solirubrobacterales bacterium]
MKRSWLLVIFGLIIAGILAMSWKPPVSKSSLKTHGVTFSNRCVTEHFVVYSDYSGEQTAFLARFAEDFRTMIDRDYFVLKPAAPMEILIFRDQKKYLGFARPVGREDSLGFSANGYIAYLAYDDPNSNIFASGKIGTLSHELMHQFMMPRLDYSRYPWSSEAIPTFFEKMLGYYDDNGKPHFTVGYIHPDRLAITRDLLAKSPNLSVFYTTEAGFTNCSARNTFLTYLHQRRGGIGKYVRLRMENGDTEQKILEKAYGKPLKVLEAEWRAWVKSNGSVPGPVNDANLVTMSLFTENQSDFEQWLIQRGSPSYDPVRKVYTFTSARKTANQ